MGSKFTHNVLAARPSPRNPAGGAKALPRPLAYMRGSLRGRGKERGAKKRERGVEKMERAG